MTGKTGMGIIEVICAGESNPEKLATLRYGACRKSEQEIAKALQSNGRKAYLFGLQQELDLYKVLQAKIELCDKEIKQLLTKKSARMKPKNLYKLKLSPTSASIRRRHLRVWI